MKRPEIYITKDLHLFWHSCPTVLIRITGLWFTIICIIASPITILFEKDKGNFKKYFRELKDDIFKYVWAKYYT